MNARTASLALSVFTLAALFIPGGMRAQQPPAQPQAAAPVQIDADDIGGVVTSRFGPETGVWVIDARSLKGRQLTKVGAYVSLGMSPDGVRLYANVYLPNETSRLPAILVRTP